jgi:hypothetical protein
MVSINAMTNTDRYRQSDVIRDQQMLSERAVDVYVRTVLEPERKARDRCKRQQALKEALRSAQDWHVESSKTNVCIEPIGISVQLSGSGPDEPENRKRVALMERLIFLARRYGV